MGVFDDFAAELERRETARLIAAGWERVTTVGSDQWRRPSDGKSFPRAEALEQIKAESQKGKN